MSWPRWVYDEGTDPDPRFTLANERTFLAWIRTSIAFMAAGVAIDALPVPYSTSVKSGLSAVLVATGILASVMAWLRWALTERAMRRGAPLPSVGVPLLLVVAVTACAVVLLVASL
jgi:putative membrane protein